MGRPHHARPVRVAPLGFLLAAVRGGAAPRFPLTCPGTIDVEGYGPVSIVPTGWPEENLRVNVVGNYEVAPRMGSRAYFSNTCIPGVYDRFQYVALNLLGKTLRYTVDLSGAGCGCNAALYLTSMRQNERPSACSDYYCDANSVCGESCAEIDIQEASQYSWHSTVHARGDHSGKGAGYGGGGVGWSGPRDWSPLEYAPGAKCIDTSAPFDVAASFPTHANGSLAALEVSLSQGGHYCPLSLLIGEYGGMAELSEALFAGMTPVVSYWSSNDMLWMDGEGADTRGPCAMDNVTSCADSIRFYGFSIQDLDERPATTTPRWVEPRGVELDYEDAEDAEDTACDDGERRTLDCHLANLGRVFRYILQLSAPHGDSAAHVGRPVVVGAFVAASALIVTAALLMLAVQRVRCNDNGQQLPAVVHVGSLRLTASMDHLLPLGDEDTDIPAV